MKSNQLDFLTEQSSNPEAVKKLFQIEVKRVRKKTLTQGILVGVLISVLVVFSVGLFLWLNQDKIAEKALEYIVSSYMSELFSTFPDAYVSFNQHKIIPILDEFTNAAANKKVSESEFREIGRSLIRALKDKKLTYHEIDAILEKMKSASKRGRYFD
jgi:hypothetical protein